MGRRALATTGRRVWFIVALAGCVRAPGGARPSGVTAATEQANAEVARKYALADPVTFEEASRGLIAAPSGQVTDSTGRVVWDFSDFAFVQGAPPPTVNPSLWRNALLNNHMGLFKVVDGIYQLRGFDLANMTLIEGKTGWIVVDTLTSRETAAYALAFARRALGDRPVSAIVFTHSHVDHFGGALGVISAEDAAARHVPILAPVGFMDEATSENVLMGPSMGRRAQYMYGSRLPRSATGLIDNGLGKAVAYGSVGILTPTEIIDHTPQPMTIDGVRFVFQNVPASEAPAELTFYLPDLKAYCGAELISHTMHNLYTIRGAKVRDAKKWAQYIDDALTSSAEAEVYFGVHHWPVFGKERIHDFLVKHRDVYRYIHDQTVRLMNAGLTMNEVAEETRLPQSLDAFIDVHGYYGTLTVNAKAVFQYYLGWYDGNPAHLNPLPPREASRRYVQLAGGSEKATAAARAAFDSGDYRWAAQLLNDVVSADPHREEARALLAETYDQLGYAAESAVWRNAYLTGAFELRHGKADRGVDTSLAVDLLQQTPVDRFFDAMAAALNGPRAEDAHLKINFVFTDLRESYVLELSNAVLHHDQAPPAADANATLTLTKGMFLKMVTGAAGVKDMLFSPELHTQGNPLDLVRFFGLFDKPRGGFPIVAPE